TLLTDQATTDSRVSELEEWASELGGADAQPPLGSSEFDPRRDTVSTLVHRTWTVPPAQAYTLVTETPALFHCGVHEVLLAALAGAVARRRPEFAGGVLVEVEGHGREPAPGTDLSRTVGWFTSSHPVRLDVTGVDLDEVLDGGSAAGLLLKDVKEQVRSVPGGDALGYGLLRYLNSRTGAVLSELPSPQIGFNYLGRFTTGDRKSAQAAEAWQLAGQTAIGGSAAPRMPALHTLEAAAVVHDGPDGPELKLTLSRPARLLDESAVEELGRAWLALLAGFAAHTTSPAAGGHTSSDFPLVDLAQDEVDELEAGFTGGVS
ncbi:MAG: non-ribosomal peptide synthetase, partial [Streptomyces sp.]|nr:non-ribosomal peptide synthetase [Streptomyces sp.]